MSSWRSRSARSPRATDDEVADAVALSAPDGAGAITGQLLDVNGGEVLG